MTNELREACKQMRDALEKEHPNAIEAEVTFYTGGRVEIRVEERDGTIISC